MIRLNRTTEYGLIALAHMSRKQGRSSGAMASAREIADQYGLPFEITAKTLQRLKESGVLVSAQGSQGGYLLSRPLSEITLAEFLEKMEGKLSIVQCCGHEEVVPASAQDACEYSPRCGMQNQMSSINQRLRLFFSGIHLDEVVSDPKQGFSPSGPFVGADRSTHESHLGAEP